MFAYITGKLTYKSPTFVILESNGIGYDISISLNTYSHIQDLEQCKLYTYFYVKEDLHALYGFSEESEKQRFTQLISVSGIGPNTARMILSSMTPEELQHAILEENVAQIESIKGIGPKSAKRLILELKDKVGQGTDHSSISTTSYNTLKEEALSALVKLGFSKLIAEKAVIKVMKNEVNDMNVENILKQALKNM